MAIIRNEDLKIMVEVEDLLHEKLVETKATKELNGIWTSYWNLVERLIVDKQKRTKIVNQRNKTIYKERHKINNAISYFRNKKVKTEQDFERLNALLSQREKMNKER
jgi:hypothetical protein